MFYHTIQTSTDPVNAFNDCNGFWKYRGKRTKCWHHFFSFSLNDLYLIIHILKFICTNLEFVACRCFRFRVVWKLSFRLGRFSTDFHICLCFRPQDISEAVYFKSQTANFMTGHLQQIKFSENDYFYLWQSRKHCRKMWKFLASFSRSLKLWIMWQKVKELRSYM